MYDNNIDLAMKITHIKIFLHIVLLLILGFLVFDYYKNHKHLQTESKYIFDFTTDPILVKAGSKPVDLMNGVETNLYSNGEFVVPMDGYIKSYNPKPINAPKQSMRYVYANKVGGKDPVCSQKQELAHVVSIEYAEMHYYSKFGYGYQVKKGDKIRFSAAFANFTDKDLVDVSAKFSIEMGPLSDNLIPVTPVYLNTVPCTSLFFVPPKTKDFVKTMEDPYEVPFDAKLIMAGSHGHNHTDTISLLKNDKAIWTTEPVKTDNGMNAGNPIYLSMGGFGYGNEGVKLKKGDKLAVSIKVSNPKDTPADAMGTMLIFLVPDNSEMAPSQSH